VPLEGGVLDGPLFGDGEELDEPALFEPLVSAKATPGLDAIVTPTPRATASAPTRPM
jgi:hypothetical protein